MKTKNVLLVGIAGWAFSCSGFAAQPAAPESGFYMGINVGRSEVDADTSGIDSGLRGLGFATSSTKVDDNDTGWRIGVGYQFNKYLAAELSFTDFGKFTLDTVTTGPSANLSGKIEGETVSLDAVVTLPLGVVDLFGRIGAHRWDVDAKLDATGPGGTASGSESDNGTDIKYGFGARWNISRNFGIQVEWERYKDIGNKDTTGKGDVDLISAGLRWKF